MFPAGLYRLTPRDLAGPGLELICRKQVVTSSSATPNSSGLYTVPDGKVLVLQGFGFFVNVTVAGAYSLKSAWFAANSPGTGTTAFGLVGNFASASLAQQIGLSYPGPHLYLPPKTTIDGFAYITTDTLTAFDFTWSLNGFTIPFGNLTTF